MGMLEEINDKLDALQASINALSGGVKADVKAPPAKPGKPAAKKEEKVEEPEVDDDSMFDAVDEEPITAEEVGAKCKTILDAKTDKKGFRAGFVKLLKDKYGADNVGKVPVEKLGDLMADVEKLGASVK